MFTTPILRALSTTAPRTSYHCEYKAKKTWPPDFTQISAKHQFRLERRYRRRCAMKYLRPGWVKGVKLVQFGLISAVTVYSVLFLDWKQDNPPFQGVRKWFFGHLDSIWTVEEKTRRRERNLDASPVSKA